jgi:hypothetical protein
MMDQEMVARMAVVSRMLMCFGVTDEDRIQAIVEATSSIPWFVPAFRGNKDAGDLLFPIAVQVAGQKTTYGAPSQGHITEAAVSLAGTVTSDQGHSSERKWVRQMRNNPAPLGMSRDEMMSIDAPKTLQIDEG